MTAQQTIPRRQRRLTIAIALNVVVVAGQVVAGVAGHSLGLLADAGHNVADVAALLIAAVAVRYSLRAPTQARSFGHHRATILAALANGGLLLAVTAYLTGESVVRLFHPADVRGGLMLVVGVAAAAVNGVAAAVVHERPARRRHDLNVAAAVLHLVADALVSLAVAAAGLVILLTHGTRWLDPAVSIVVSIVIAAQAVRLLHRSADVLLESTPRDIVPDDVAAAIAAIPLVVDVHDLHVWCLSSQLYAMSAHVALSGHPSLEEAQAAADVIKIELASRFSIGHATIEMECEVCPEPDPCTLESAGSVAAHSHVTPAVDDGRRHAPRTPAN
jgi:cobalt-zinc-cadmium efflux system protein